LGVHSGVYGAVLGPSGELGYLSQALPTTPGQLYLISFWLDCVSGGVPNEVGVTWDGVSLFHGVNLPAFGWTNVQIRAVATRSGTILRFSFRNDPWYFGFDDVSVVAISMPEFIPGGVSIIKGNISLTWASEAGLNYQLQYSTGLNPANWLDLGAPVTATDFTTTGLDSSGSDPQRFYRVVLLP
jgi:hypothetical protein